MKKNFESDYLHNIVRQYDSELVYSSQYCDCKEHEKPHPEAIGRG